MNNQNILNTGKEEPAVGILPGVGMMLDDF